MKVKRFEELIAWQEARKLAQLVYSATNMGRMAKDYGLRDQIQRAAVSVGSNIKEFARFLWIAKGSAGEVVPQLYTAVDIGYLTDEQFESLSDQARRCSYIIYKLIQSLH